MSYTDERRKIIETDRVIYNMKIEMYLINGFSLIKDSATSDVINGDMHYSCLLSRKYDMQYMLFGK